MSDHVVSAVSESGVVESVAVAAETASKSISVQKLFLLPVFTSGFVTDIWVSDDGRCRAVSAVSH